MTTESNSNEARDLKRMIAEGEFRSLIDVVLDGVGSLLQKLIRRPDLPAPWVSALAIALSISLIGSFISLISGDVSQHVYRTLFLGGGLTFLCFIIPRSINQRIVVALHDQLLDAVETSDGLTSLHGWLTALASRRWPILCGLLYLGVSLLYGAFFLEDIDPPVDIAVMGLPLLFISGMMIYYLLLKLVLPGRLGRCHFRLNAWDPASTEVVAHLSSLLNYIAYMIAFLLTAIALFAISLVTFDVSNLIFAIPTWLALIVIFVAGQRSLSRIIQRAKRKSLYQVETQMAALRSQGDSADKETMEIFMRMWDYHDRIRDTRDSVLDLKGIMNFINTLLIPLLTFLVANRSEVFQVLGWAK